MARPSRDNDRDLLNLHLCPIYTLVHRFEPNLYIQLPMLYRPISSPRFICRTFDLCIQRQVYISIYPSLDLYIRLQIYIYITGFIYPTPDLYIQHHNYISAARFINPAPDLYIRVPIYISDTRFIYLTPNLYIQWRIYISPT